MGMTIDNVLEILEKHKLRIPSNVFYELKADIVNFEEPTTKDDAPENNVGNIEPTTKNDLSEEDILELKHRYGDEVEFVVRDMISGEGKRWE